MEPEEHSIANTAQSLDQSAKKVESQTDRILKLLTRIAWLVTILVVVTIGLAVLVQRNNRNNDETQRVLDEVHVTVDHLEDFVNELEAPDGEEDVARNEAISRAVQLVPVILQILCEANPEVPSCQTQEP